MGALHLDDLSIKGYRGIRDLSISGLGRVTLVTGRNNTGKSSVLEAVYLYVGNGLPSSLVYLLESREQYQGKNYEEGYLPEIESVLLISSLFHDFPHRPEQFAEPITVSAKGTMGVTKLTVRVSWATEEQDLDGRRKLVAIRNRPEGDLNSVIALSIETEERTGLYHLNYFLRARSPGIDFAPYPMRDVRMPLMLIDSYSEHRPDQLASLWDVVALTDDEQEVVGALQIIDPNISAVSMVESGSNRKGRRAVVRASNISRPVPLGTFGDGASRIFALALALVNARGGILLIDEFENGLHHTVQLDVWRTIFRLAMRLDVQVFATTHSQDTVRAFQEAAAESPEEGVLVRLTRKGEDIVPTVANEEELAVAARHDIEVR